MSFCFVLKPKTTLFNLLSFAVNRCLTLCHSFLFVVTVCHSLCHSLSLVVTRCHSSVRHKNRRKHNQHFRSRFFKINLHFVTPNQISAYKKLNLSLINSVYLIFFTLDMQRRVVQINVYYTIFTLSEKKRLINP